MTLILNVLHKDMSILAADRKARAEWPASAASITTVPAGSGLIVHNFNKFTMNLSRTLALGIAGLTEDHRYTQAIEQSDSIDVGLRAIRKHIESFVPTYDRASLSTLSAFMKNEGLVSFFDQSMGMYFTNKYLFSPIEIQTRLHRATDEVKIFCAGSGSRYFEGEDASVDVTSFIASTKRSFSFEACISWIQAAYKKVSDSDPESGAEPVFLISTRSNPEFRFL